ncbi:MAG: HlyC/CorC family transporter [Cytophagales bacterium]|nr:HlyC/CorC family transporter [Armatimonadota bacterium]
MEPPSQLTRTDPEVGYQHAARRRVRLRAQPASASPGPTHSASYRRVALWAFSALTLTLGGFLALRYAPSALAQEAITATRTAAAPPPVPADTTLAALWSLGSVFVLTLLNGAFSMAETALVAVRPSRVEQLAEEGRRGARTVQRLIENPPRFIATTQVGITLLGFASAAAGATFLAPPLIPVLHRLFGGSGPVAEDLLAQIVSVVVVTIPIALFTMILGEIAPKSLAAQAPDVWAMRLAPFLSFCAILFTPLSSLVLSVSNLLVRPFGAHAQFQTPMITREEFEKIIEGSEKHGEIDDDEADIIRNVFDLSETTVRSVMTPRIDMTALSVEATLEKTLDTILTSGHSRVPVYEGTIDTIVGIVHAKDLLPLFQENRQEVDLRQVMREAYFVPETKRVSDLLAEFRRSNQQLAVVQDEYTGTEGIVSLEDLIEEIVGDIRDEYDVDEPEVQVLSETESIIDGRMSIDDVNDRLGTELPREDVNTIGGLVFSLLGQEPVPGDRVRSDGVEFVVEEMDGQRVSSVRAIQSPDSDPNSSEEITRASVTAG